MGASATFYPSMLGDRRRTEILLGRGQMGASLAGGKKDGGSYRSFHSYKITLFTVPLGVVRNRLILLKASRGARGFDSFLFDAHSHDTLVHPRKVYSAIGPSTNFAGCMTRVPRDSPGLASAREPLSDPSSYTSVAPPASAFV